MSNEPWLVIGGGIGGLSTALALGLRGQRVRLMERAPEFTEIGAGLQIGANATRMMDRLGILDAVREVAVHPRRGLLMDAISGQALTELDTGEAYLRRYGTPYLVTHRRDLLDILLAACRDTGHVVLEAGNEVTEVHPGEHQAAVRCAGGGFHSADVVVGADGMWSVARGLIDETPPRWSGYVAFRGTLPSADVHHEIVADDVVIWVGPGMHLVQYPVRRGELYNQVAVFRSRQRADAIDESILRGELSERFAGACRPVREALAEMDTSRSWPIFERDPLPTWRRGRVVLIGDAAHPMLQYLGQGACQAMEDAVCLAAQCGAVSPGDGVGLDAALERFERIRKPRASECQLRARPWGELWHTGDPLTIALRNRLLRARRPDDYSDVDWLYATESTRGVA